MFGTEGRKKMKFNRAGGVKGGEDDAPAAADIHQITQRKQERMKEGKGKKPPKIEPSHHFSFFFRLQGVSRDGAVGARGESDVSPLLPIGVSRLFSRKESPWEPRTCGNK